MQLAICITGQTSDAVVLALILLPRQRLPFIHDNLKIFYKNFQIWYVRIYG